MTTAPCSLLLRLCLLSLGLAGLAHAGRPLNVDDAGVDDKGTGHVDAWYARGPAGARGWTVAPAYSPWEGVEIGVSAARDTRQRTRTTGLQGKLLLTPSRSDGCNAGVGAGVSQTSGTPGSTPSLTGLLTCNHEGGAAHVNLGGTHTSGAATLRTWGVAYERELGRFTAHVEWYGQKLSAPVAQIGLRTDIAPGWQLDASVGRTRLVERHERLYSLGMVYRF